MKKSILKTKKILVLLFASIISIFVYGQAGFQPSGGVFNTTSALTIHNNVYIGRGVNGLAANNQINTAVGSNTLSTVSTTGGGYNTAIGYEALKRNNSGYYNVAIGIAALGGTLSNTNNEGAFNTAIGDEALNRNSSGNYLAALGYRAMQNNSSGEGNVAFGYRSLDANTVGANNCALGRQALYVLNSISDSSKDNTAVGFFALGNLTKGSRNVAIGKYSAYGLTRGQLNVAIGEGTTLSDGNYQLNIQNCIYGVNMGNGTYGGNVAVGATPNVVSGGTYVGTTAKFHVAGTLRIGTVSTGTATGEYLFVDGNGMVSKAILPSVGCATNKRVTVSNGSALTCSQIYDDGTSVGIGTAYNTGTPNFNYTYTGTSDWHVGSSNPTVNSTGNLKLAIDGVVKAWVYYATSDSRYKKNIKPLGNVVKIIKLLNGVSYEWNKEDFPFKDFSAVPQIGFIAQEVEKVIPQAVIKDKDGYYAMNYSTIIPVLTEGIKEQQTQLESQTLEIENLKSQIADLRNKLNQITIGDVKLKGNSIEVVPNPITGTSVVSYKFDNTNATSFLIISDLQGKLVKQISLAKNQTSVQVSKNDLPNGMYVFTIVSGNTEVQSKKVLVAE
jgi:trimeric autotransporter adhesin